MVSALWFCIKGMLEMRMEDSFLSPMNEPQCGWCPFWSWEWRIWSAVKVNTYAWFVCCYGTISMGGFTLVLPRVKYLISVDLNLVSEWDWVMFPPGEKNLVVLSVLIERAYLSAQLVSNPVCTRTNLSSRKDVKSPRGNNNQPKNRTSRCFSSCFSFRSLITYLPFRHEKVVV